MCTEGMGLAVCSDTGARPLLAVVFTPDVSREGAHELGALSPLQTSPG